jgi:LysM repeat protein
VPEDSVEAEGGRPDSVVPRSPSNRTVSPAIAGALIVLAASFALSVAFVLANGGLNLPAAQRPSGSGGVAEVVPSATVTGSAEASAAPTETATAAVSPAPSSTEPSDTPTPSATTAAPTTGATPQPSSNRYDLLTACPSTPDCWVYVVRQGDNLSSIARYFGVPLATVETLNPWTRTTQLVAGQKLRLPAPTR